MAKREWYPNDAQMHADEKIVELVAEFGPGGGWAIVVLLGQAKMARDNGKVSLRWRSFARMASTDNVDQARAIVVLADEVDLLQLLDDSARKFTVKFNKWGEWQSEKALAAERKRRQRERERSANSAQKEEMSRECHGDVTEMSQDVTEVSRSDRTTVHNSTEQYITEHNKTKEPNGSLTKSAISEIARDLFGYWQEQCDHPKAILDAKRKRKISERLKSGRTADEIRTAIDGAARNAYVDSSGVKHDDIELICRDDSKLNLFIARSKSKPGLFAQTTPVDARIAQIDAWAGNDDVIDSTAEEIAA